MPEKLVFATNNLHKIEEVSAKLGGSIDLKTLDDIGCSDEIVENGNTFIENASIKSHFIFEKYGLDCFGDDSGLEVEALQGEPGVFSARYAGKHGDHSANIDKLLHKLEHVENRRARFITVISLIWQGTEYFFEGTVSGNIRRGRSGNGGFGYDPVFEPDGFDRTFAEMSLEEKNKLSHRATAVEKLVIFLQQNANLRA